MAASRRYASHSRSGEPTLTCTALLPQSVYFYQPSLVPNYDYPSSIDWENWWSWNQAASFATDRAYDYVHVTVGCVSFELKPFAYDVVIRQPTGRSTVSRATTPLSSSCTHGSGT